MKEKKNKMTVLQLTILTAVNMLGSGIIMLPTKLAEVGTSSILSWIVTAVGAMTLAYAFSKCGMFSRKAAGMGGYAEYSFGKAGSFLANYTYGISLLIANVAIAISAVGYSTVLLGVRPSPVAVGFWTIFTLWSATVLNFGGPRITGRIGSITVWGAILPILVVSIFGWYYFSVDLYKESWNPYNYSFFTGIIKSISITLWAFLGLESACSNMDAVENPQRNVPIAVLGGTLGAAIIYIISTNLLGGIVPNEDLLTSNAPFGLAFALMFNAFIGKIVIAAMIISCFGSLLGWQFTISQLFKISANEEYFPRIFGKVTKTGTPIMGMIILTVLQTLLSLMTISPTLSKQFDILVNLAVVTNLIPYLLSMAALNVIQRSANVSKTKAKLTNIIGIIASIYSVYALYACGYEAVTYGAIVTFIGWLLYGLISYRFDLKNQH